jgi:YD repeat-containing protein
LRVAAWIAAGVLSACALGAQAGTERYEYDSLGRLIRYVNPAGLLTEYIYDAVGNILEVRRSTDVGPPAITLVSPDRLRRGQTVTIQLQGARLAGTQIGSPHPALDVSGLRSTASLLSFILTPGESAPLGAQSFSVANAFGSTAFVLTVEPALPALVADPSPVVLLPLGQQQVTLRLSSPDQVAHTATLTVANPALAVVSPATIQFAPGQTEATATITAVALGNTALNIGSATLDGRPVGIFVTTPAPAGPATRYAPSVGVLRQAAPNAGTRPLGPVVAPNVGVERAFSPSVGQSRTVTPLIAPNVGVERQ